MSAPSTIQRILQFEGRRYSLKLEPAFWSALAAAARARGLRAGRLVGQLAQAMPKAGNLASYLRVFCLEEAGRRQQEEAVRAQRAEQRATVSGIDALVDHCPAACLVVSHSRRILRGNKAFGAWYGPAAIGLAGRPFDHFFRLRSAQPIEEIFAGFAAGHLAPARAHLLYVVPGRVVAAPAQLIPVGHRAADDFLVVMMVTP